MKLGVRLAIIYGLIILCTITVIDILLIESYRRSRYAEIEPGYFAAAGVLSVMTAMEFYDGESLDRFVNTYGSSINGRILILNTDSMVLADSYKELNGRSISNKVLDKALNESSRSISYHELNKRKTMMCTAPVYNGTVTIGAVLISAYVQDVEEAIAAFARKILIISGLTSVISCLVAYLTGKRLIKPVKELTEAALMILGGKSGVQVQNASKDEIGSLAKTFNTMSFELHQQEVDRRAFLSKVSHELKTPLASIKALIESLLIWNNSIETYNEYLTDVNCEIDRLSGLVSSLLTIERLEEIKIKKEEINVHKEIMEVFKLLKPLADRGKIKLMINCSENACILGDRDAVREILINLVDNGIKYGRENGYINVGLEASANGSIAKLWVEDDGNGIPQELLPRIFDNFTRADADGKSTGGSGVGLYIVKRLVDLHQWTITASGNAGGGTRFDILIQP